MSWKTVIAAVSILLLPACGRPAPVTLQIGDVVAKVEIAATAEERSRGLMYRESLDANSGMLLIFPKDGILKLWMKNVRMPLDVAFFNREGRLINIASMEPDGGKTLYSSAAPARYALEMNKGWFARHGLEPGAYLHLTPALRRLSG